MNKLFCNSGAYFCILVLYAVPPATGNTLVGDGGWCWFADPRGVYYHGDKEQTYIGWITGSGAVQVGSYDHQSGITRFATLREAFETDDHDNPSLLIRAEDRRVIVFYSKHTQEPRLYYRISDNPEDITTFSDERQVGGITDNVTYPTPFQLADEDNRIYLFWRGIGWQPTVATSSDGGESWSPPRQLIQGADRPYIKYESDNKHRIHFAFTDGHPRENPGNRIYYACLYDGAFHRADGTVIKQFSEGYLSTAEAEIVYDASLGRGWIWDIALDNAGNPVLVYAALPAENDHHYRYARWTGSQWRDRELTAAGGWFPQTWPGTTEREPHYSGGLVLDHGNPSIVYLSRPVNGVFEIEKWETGDNGVSWATKTAITANSSVSNVRPYVIRNHKPDDFALLWIYGYYRHYTDYHMAITTNYQSVPPLRSGKIALDFGVKGFPAGGYARVDPGTRWFAGSFGWLDTTGNRASSRFGTTGPKADLVFNSEPRTFRIDVPDGTYSVTVTMGDLDYAHDDMSITINDSLVASAVSTDAGSWHTVTCDEIGADGHLSFSFADNGGENEHWVINAITVTPLLVTATTAPVASCSRRMSAGYVPTVLRPGESLKIPPVKGAVAGKTPVTVYSLNGKRVLQTFVEHGTEQLHESGAVPPGVYILRTPSTEMLR